MGGIISKRSSHKTKNPNFDIKYIFALPHDLKKSISCEWLTSKEMENVENAANPVLNRHKNLTLFKDVLTEMDIAHYVLTGSLERLISALKFNPDIFFKRFRQIKDAAGQVFYNVSCADLIDFLRDGDMQNQVITFASSLPLKECQLFFNNWEDQRSDRARGGADLVNVNIDPTTMQFNDILVVSRPCDSLNSSREQCFSLLKNPNGIIYYANAEKEHWYYADSITKTIERIDISEELLIQHKNAYTKFISRMNNMEPFSARRSSNNEHQLIETLMHIAQTKKAIQIVREGIKYTQNGVDYCDTHYDFNRIYNAYRKCIRLYEENKKAQADAVWRGQVGHTLREVMHLIQRLCEENRPFYPLPKTRTAFIRSFKIKNLKTGAHDLIFDVKKGAFHTDFGCNSATGFSIYKCSAKIAEAAGKGGIMNKAMGWVRAWHCWQDLIALHQEIEIATKQIAEFNPTQILSQAVTDKISRTCRYPAFA